MLVFAAAMLSIAVSAQEYESTIRRWDDGPLSWDDFYTFANTETSLPADLYYGWRGQRMKYRKGNLLMRYYNIYTYMNTRQSWVNPYSKSPSLLRYEQMIFDYTELCRRQYLQELRNDTENKYSSKELSDFYFSKISRYEAEIGPQCEYGRDSSSLNYYYSQVTAQLDSTKDFTEPFYRKGNWALGFEIGYLYEGFPGTVDQYLSTCNNFRFGFTVSYKNIWFEAVANAKDEGVNAVDFYHGDVRWAPGLKRRTTNWDFNLGYSVLDNNWLRLIPFAGIAASQHTVVLGKAENGEEVRDGTAGLRFQAGLAGDLKFFRYGAFNMDYSEYSARLLAYAARTNIPGYGPRWSYNLGVMLNMTGWFQH